MPAEITTDKRPVGILAGEGVLPLYLYNHCRENDIPVAVVMFKGCAYANWPDDIAPCLRTGLEKVGAIFDFLRDNNVENVVMIGNLARPSLKSLRPDWRGLKTLGRIAGAFMQGDDNLLRSLRDEIEAEGFTVRGVDCYLDNLTSAPGFLTEARPDDAQMTLIRNGIKASKAHGMADKGQSVLVHPDNSISYEQDDGTSALIRRDGRAGSILVKTMKPGQDPDMDRPTVGLNTLQALKDKNCAGLAVEADSVFLIDRTDMVAFAKAGGLFITAEAIRD